MKFPFDVGQTAGDAGVALQRGRGVGFCSVGGGLVLGEKMLERFGDCQAGGF